MIWGGGMSWCGMGFILSCRNLCSAGSFCQKIVVPAHTVRLLDCIFLALFTLFDGLENKTERACE